MIGRKSAELGNQRRTVEIRQLFGVQFHRQAELLCAIKDAPGFHRAEADVLAECVHRVDQSLSGECGQHVVADQRDSERSSVGE